MFFKNMECIPWSWYNYIWERADAVDLEQFSQKLDFFGLNCNNRADPLLLNPKTQEATGGNFMENGAEYYPKAVYDALHILTDDYHIGIPIYLTENGTYNCEETVCVAGRIHETTRNAYVESFLQWIQAARASTCVGIISGRCWIIGSGLLEAGRDLSSAWLSRARDPVDFL